jgi:hypothetical protein
MKRRLNLVKPDIVAIADWDFVQKPISITKLIDNVHLPKGEKKIVVERDDEYNLKGTLNFEDPSFFPRRNEVAGTFHKGFDIQGFSNDDSILYALESCHIGSIKFQGASDFVGTADLRFNKFRMKLSENNPNHLTVWYINGPDSYVHFSSAEVHTIQYCTREQFLSNREQKNSTSTPLCKHFSSELIWSKNKDDFNFLVNRVPNTLGPKWSTNVGIEYHEDWGRIPESGERLKIEELCSFVFGKHLLSVGYTTYDKDENVVEVFAQSPWGHSAKFFCSQPEYPPIRINDYPPGDAEKIINYLLPKYIEVSEHLRLEEALWNYWISFNIPIGPNLPIIASAIETIINSWYNWTKTQSHGVYMEKTDFTSLLREELDSIKKKLDIKYADEKKKLVEQKIDEKTDGEKMLNKILTTNEFGITEKMRRFFKEINLSVTQAEKDAIKGRHLFVHGDADYDKEDWEEVVRKVNTLHTLFNRTLLKILEYNWDYIDRSVEGWPDAKLG